MKIEIVRYILIEKGSTLAKATIKVPKWGNVIIEGVTFIKQGSGRWINFPTRKDEMGKYWPYIRFESRDLKSAFDKLCFEALEDKIAIGKSTESTPDFPDFL